MINIKNDLKTLFASVAELLIVAEDVHVSVFGFDS